MALPEKPPLMLVEAGALNEAEEREGRSGSGHSHGPVFHTRGLTLTAEYRAVRQVITREGRVLTQPVDLSARDRFEVRHSWASADHDATAVCNLSSAAVTTQCMDPHLCCTAWYCKSTDLQIPSSVRKDLNHAALQRRLLMACMINSIAWCGCQLGRALALGRSTAEPASGLQVTAILVLYGLPWLLTGSILAHECMHAWLRLRGVTRLPLETEEGLCQLMALLWLEAQDLSKKQVTFCTAVAQACKG